MRRIRRYISRGYFSDLSGMAQTILRKLDLLGPTQGVIPDCTSLAYIRILPQNLTTYKTWQIRWWQTHPMELLRRSNGALPRTFGLDWSKQAEPMVVTLTTKGLIGAAVSEQPCSGCLQKKTLPRARRNILGRCIYLRGLAFGHQSLTYGELHQFGNRFNVEFLE